MTISGSGPSSIFLWVFSNILFAWLGMIDFLLPVMLAVFGGNKWYCNNLCGRGQLLMKLGTDLKLSRNRMTPRWMSKKWFRYAFLIFFLAMFGNMIFQTYLVGSGASSLKEAVQLFWSFQVPWGWSYAAGSVPGLHCEIQLRILQHYADIDDSGTDRHAAVQTEILVYILPDGNDDTGHLQSQGES